MTRSHDHLHNQAVDHLLEHLTIHEGLAHLFWGWIISAVVAIGSLVAAKKSRQKKKSKPLQMISVVAGIAVICFATVNKPKSESKNESGQKAVTKGDNSPAINVTANTGGTNSPSYQNVQGAQTVGQTGGITAQTVQQNTGITVNGNIGVFSSGQMGGITAQTVILIITNASDTFEARLTCRVTSKNEQTGERFVTKGEIDLSSRYPIGALNVRVMAPTIKDLNFLSARGGNMAMLTRGEGYCDSSIPSAYGKYFFRVTSSAREEFVFKFSTE